MLARTDGAALRVAIMPLPTGTSNNYARDLKERPNGNFVYSGNEYVPNDDEPHSNASAASNSTAPDGYRLPTVNGKPVDVAPTYGYDSPHLTAPVYGGSVVRASYGAGYVLEYDFDVDTIARVK